MKEKILKIILITFLILTVALADIVGIGFTYVIYAANEADNSNIEFDVFFKNANNESVYNIEEIISKDPIKMGITLKVKDKGYFNGKIIFNECNFDLKNTISSEYVNSIEENVINLNQINACKTVEIEVEIIPKKAEIIDVNFLNANNKVILSGIYKDIEGKDKDVNVEKNVNLILTPAFKAEDKWVNVESQIITNNTYEVEGKTKRIIQLLIKNKVLDNSYPIKETNIEVTVPQKPESVNVQSKGTLSTNGKEEMEFQDNQWKYLQEEDKVKINVKNDVVDGKINWRKGTTDNFIVTYIYDGEANLNEENIEIKSSIGLYDNKNTNQEAVINQTIGEKKDGIVKGEIINHENTIYKGKIFSKEDRELLTTNVVNVNAKGFSNYIELYEDSTVFVGENIRLNANIKYNYTKFKKQELERVLGAKGYIVITDADGKEIARVNKDTPANEQGEIIVNYDQLNLSNVNFKINTPENQGKIEINNSKKIIQNDIVKKQLDAINILEQTVMLKTDTKTEKLNSNIKLENTTTRASVGMNIDNLSAGYESQNVDISVVLNSDEEKDTLYKNPVIEVEFPEEVEKVEFKRLRKLYEKELKIKNVATEAKKIRVELEGEQTKYKTNEISNATLIINADVSLNKNSEAKSSQIKLKYLNQNDNITNEASKQFEILRPIREEKPAENTNVEEQNATLIQTQNVNANVNFVAKVGGETLGNGAEVKQGEVIKYTIKVKNTGSKDISGANISTVVPEGTVWVEPYQGEMGSEHTGEIYYEEKVDKKEISYDIETLKPGETQVFEFEVRVKLDTAENTEISNKVSIKTVDGITETEKITNVVKNAKLRVSFKTVYEKEIGRYAGGSPIGYLVILDNISQENLKNVHVDVMLPEHTEISHMSIPDGDEVSSIEFESIGKGETKSAFIYLKYTAFEEDSKILGTYTIATINGQQEKYRSNLIEETVKNLTVTMETKATKQNENIVSGEEIQYTIKVNNDTDNDYGEMGLLVELPKSMNITYVKYNDIEETQEIHNTAEYTVNVKPKSTEEIIIKAKVDYNSEEKTSTEISTISLNIRNKKMVTNEVKHIITVRPIDTPNPENPDPENPDPENPDPENPDKPGEDDKKEKFSISGFAWEDKDENGIFETAESKMSGINVMLLAENGNVISTTTTAQDGSYTFKDIEEGKYIVGFIYNNEKYKLTQYKTDDESDNTSKVITKELTINGKTNVYSVTDVIELKNKDVTYINIGLIQLKTFDLELNKYVSKIEIENNEGVKAYHFNNTNLAKVEITNKQIANSKVTIEYDIIVSNKGEVPGYARSIVDYLPEGYDLTSGRNDGWTRENNNLYYKDLAKIIINPGESKTIKVVLDKKLKDNDTGIVNNMAEIAESSNVLGLADANSIPANKMQGENDLGTADVIISVKTGKVILYISLIMTSLAILTVGIYFINKKVLKK